MKDKRDLYILCVAVASMAIASSITGFAGLLRGHAEIDRSEWMKTFSDDLSLRQIAIPGTHDSVATRSIGDLSGEAQTLNLEDQLYTGVRFFDIRLKLQGSSLRGFHGIVDQKIGFDKIQKTFDTFLEKHPSETILVSIKDEANSSDQTAFASTLKETLSERWYIDTELPSNLGQARGKAILFSRFGGDFGIPCYHGWLTNDTFTLPNGIFVQDFYKTDDVEAKKEAIRACFEEGGHPLKINFLSGYRPSSFPPDYAPSIAKEINPWIKEAILDVEDPNVVLYDFVTDGMLDSFFEGRLPE